jgi:hypothetical protein
MGPEYRAFALFVKDKEDAGSVSYIVSDKKMGYHLEKTQTLKKGGTP